MTPKIRSLFEYVQKGDEESFQTLLSGNKFRLERIESYGHRTPEGEWYDQEQAEWVVVVRGAARLAFEGQADALELKPGDYILIPPHVRHRVEWTDPEGPTVWLALHYED